MNFKEYQKKTLDTWISNDKELERILLSIAGETGEICEYFKKFYRGDYLTINYDDIGEEIGDILYYLAMLCNYLDISLDHTALKNLLKLQDRKNRNVIKGNGSNR